MEKPIYIFGHKNPDADAICSAIGYQDYKRAKGYDHYIAVRCGNSNSRIDAILKRFRHPLPPFIGDVTPRVHDIMVRDVLQVSVDATCTDALAIIDKHDVRSVPVVRDDQTVEGLVSIFRLGEFFIPKPKENVAIRRVHTSINAIIQALDAKVIHLCEPEKIEELYVRIGAMDIRSFGRFVDEEKTSPDQSVIIVGDRWDIQQKAIRMGVRLLVITGNLDIEEEVIESAKERGVSIISSPYDSATTSWVTRTATLLEPMIQREIITFNPDEPLVSVRRKVANTNASTFIVVDDHDRLLGLFSKTDLLKPVDTKIVLVDHNETSQAVAGADEVEIVEIIDHHRLGNLPTPQPILFHNEPVGSTSTIVADMFRREGLTPNQDTAGILMSGIISDTLNLRSPTSTAKDETLLKWLSEIAQTSIDELSDLIFSSGSIILNSTPEKVITTDCKIYEESKVRFSVSQIEELGFDNFRDHEEEIVQALANYCKENNLLFSTLLVTCIRSQNSLLVLQGSEEVMDAVTYPTVDHDYIFDLPGIVSRKKQLIPYLTSLLGSIGLVT